ncbi:MAG: hypothetical protein WCI88_09820 [Chloroflexota bacterium]
MQLQRKAVGVTLVLIGLFAIGVSVFALFRRKHCSSVPSAPVKQKIFSRLVAEGMRYRDTQNIGIDRFAFKSCRIEKRHSGAITFGAFNVLVIDGLVLNLPAESFVPAKGSPVEDSTFDWIKGNRLGESLLRSQGMSESRISGIRINGLTVNRCDHTNGLRRIFSAGQAASGTGGESLRLWECEVRTHDGNNVRVNKARLMLRPNTKLVYYQDGTNRSVDL